MLLHRAPRMLALLAGATLLFTATPLLAQTDPTPTAAPGPTAEAGAADDTAAEPETEAGDEAGGQTVYTLEDGQPRDLVLSPDGSHAALTTATDLFIVPLDGDAQTLQLEGEAAPIGVWWSPDSRFVASGSADGFIQVWSVADGGYLGRADGDARPVRVITWAPDAIQIAFGGDSGSVFLLNIEEGTIQEFTGHTGRIRGLDWSTDGAALLSVADDGAVLRWPVSAQPLAAPVPPTADAAAPVAAPAPVTTTATVLAQPALNVRAGPATTFDRVASAAPNSQLTITGQYQDCAWYTVIAAGGETGWTSGDPALLSVETPCADLPEVNAEGEIIGAPEPVAATAAPAPAAAATITATAAAEQPAPETPAVLPTPTPAPPAAAQPPAAPGCFTFRNQVEVDVTLTFTAVDRDWSEEYTIATGAEQEICFEPGNYDYVMVAPDPFEAQSGAFTVESGADMVVPIGVVEQ